MSNTRKIRIVYLFIGMLCSAYSFAQHTDSTSDGGIPDSIPHSRFVRMIRKLANQETSDKIRTYREGKISIAQRHTVEGIKSVSQRVKLYLKDALDTSIIAEDLETAGSSMKIAKDGVFTNKGTVQTQRNLSVTAAIFTELLDNISSDKLLLDKYSNDLIDFKDKLDSLLSDSSLYFFHADSLAIINYARRLTVVNKETSPVDSLLKTAMSSVQELQLKVDLMLYELHAAGEDVETYRSGLASGVLNRELSNIAGPVGYNRPVSEIIRFSRAKEKLVLGFYVREHVGRILLILLLIFVAGLFASSVKKMTGLRNLEEADSSDEIVLKYPWLSSVFVVLNLFQFIFINPPFIFNFCIWLIAIISLTVIFRHAVSAYWRKCWYVVIVFFLLTASVNFMLQASRSERWFMLALSAAGVLIVLYIFFTSRLKDLRERGVIYFIVIVGLLETASFFFNWFGRFNFSKSLLITGYTGMAVAISFFWTVRLINEMLGLAYKLYKFPERSLFYINFDRVGTEAPGILYVLLVMGWFIITGRNFYAFKQIVAPLENFLTKTRTVGEFAFSIGSIFLFMMILVSSMLLSRIISFFASSPPTPHGTSRGDRIGIGSWLLLIRIFIISLGLLLAFAATGIQIDRLTIILGALGVGVGLGLQSLVTNLVSGLIIAFEKPVNVGDMLEVNGKIAMMKSIGFRSSIARLSDGSHVVIPNGDVLNQHLVNWSIGGNMKKTSILLGVAYGTDTDLAAKVFMQVLKANESALAAPPPAVFAKNFGAYTIEFELSFWVSNLNDADAIKSTLIIELDTACKNAGIVIPTPQQDIHIRSLPDNKGSNGI